MGVYRASFNGKYAGLAWDFQVNPDSCGNHSHYENYLRTMAGTDYRTGKGNTYIFVDDSNDENHKIIGYFTMRASSLIIKSGGDMNGRSAVEITELAVDRSYEKQGYGRLLVEWAFAIADDVRKQYIGVEYILVCAVPEAILFYEKMGFGKVQAYEEIPREGWNQNCVPMLVKLSEV